MTCAAATIKEADLGTDELEVEALLEVEDVDEDLDMGIEEEAEGWELLDPFHPAGGSAERKSNILREVNRWKRGKRFNHSMDREVDTQRKPI